MVENKVNWNTILIVLVIGVGILLLNSGILTGNVISVAKGYAGKVYTTAEIDAKLKNVATNQGVLTMLSKCTPSSSSVINYGSSMSIFGDEMCKGTGKKCILSEVEMFSTLGSSFESKSEFVACNTVLSGRTIDINTAFVLHAVCCSP